MSWTLYPISEFPKHQDQWQALNLENMASPLLETDFVVPLLEEFGSGNEILACYKRGGKVQAITILSPQAHGAWATFQPSQAPVGMWIQGAGMEWNHLLSTLIRKLPGFPLLLGVTQQDPQLLPRPEDQGTIKTLDYIRTAKILLQGSFEDYWSARGKNLRQNMKKQRNKLEKEGVALRMQISTAPEEVAQAIIDYGRLESSGWKAEQGTAVSADNAQGRFYRSMLEGFCTRGAGRIYRYWYNDRIAAMNLCIEGNGIIVVLKTTYDESIDDGTSPAFLLREEQSKGLFDEGRMKSLEFYGKLMEWHLKWTGEVRSLYHINNYRFPLLSRLHSALKKPAPAASEAG